MKFNLFVIAIFVTQIPLIIIGGLAYLVVHGLSVGYALVEHWLDEMHKKIDEK